MSRKWIVGGIVAGVLFMGCATGAILCAGLVVGVAPLASEEYQMKGRRGAVGSQVGRIREQILYYETANGRLPGAIGQEAPPPGPDPGLWASGPGWEAIQFVPYIDEVWGSFWVEDRGTDFRVVARTDLDGDGVYAEWQATRDMPATLVTPEDVW